MKHSPEKNAPVLRGWLHGRIHPDGSAQVAVWCPYCRRLHLHGWDTTAHNRGRAEHRVAHCCNDASPFRADGYWIGLLPREALPEACCGRHGGHGGH